MDVIFDWCVRVLVYLAGAFGISYKQINVWVFVILWPAFTLALIALAILQHARIRRLQKKAKDG